MPPALVAYWDAWNEPDAVAVRRHLEVAVDDHVEWNDPRDSFVGRVELEAAVQRLHASKPEYRFVIASEIDHHHSRYRYRWDMVRGSRVLMEGTDIVTISGVSGRITRIDGFFGDVTPLKEIDSGVPATHRRQTNRTGA
ncbi:MAG: nuclear transport factor 2 family protein [Actinomycetota bacterium]